VSPFFVLVLRSGGVSEPPSLDGLMFPGGLGAALYLNVRTPLLTRVPTSPFTPSPVQIRL